MSARAGEWGTWQPFQYCGNDVAGRTLGIVGLGRIGLTFAKFMSGFNCKVLYSGPREKAEMAAEIGAEYCQFEDLLARSDIVSVHCPLMPATEKLINADALKKMKPSAVLINTSRGGVVDQDALAAALREGTIAGAGLDVTDPEPLPTDHELFTLSNCTVLPHVGSATMGTREKMQALATDNLIAGLKGEALPHAVVQIVGAEVGEGKA